MGGREASDAEMYGSDPHTGAPADPEIEAQDEAVRGRGYNEELGWGQDGWDNEEIMDDPFRQESDDGGLFGGGGDGGGGDWGDWS
jgi:hypothetical protein